MRTPGAGAGATSPRPGSHRCEEGAAIELRIKVVPGASRSGLAGWLGDVLKVRVTAPAERGKANAAVEQVLADALDVPRRCVRIVAGHTAARKVVEIVELSESELRRRLPARPS